MGSWTGTSVSTAYARVYGGSRDCWAPVEVTSRASDEYAVTGEPTPATDLKAGDVLRCMQQRFEEGSRRVVRCQLLPGGIERYRIDGAAIGSESDFHNEVADALGVFDGYGANLDALWDVLCDDSGLKWAQEPFQVLWLNSQRSRQTLERFQSIVELFRTVKADGRLIDLLLDEEET